MENCESKSIIDHPALREIQLLRNENAALKAEVASLRKSIDQIDFKLRNRPEFLAQKIGCVVWCHAKKRPTWTLESMKQEILKCLKR